MHDQFLLAALEQARNGSGQCAPNPAVGAVAVQNNQIIARAWHKGVGQPHAEQLLVNKFAAHTKDVTVYVTLEPCNHYGRTPPCTEALIQHGVCSVVYAYADPNPLVAINNTPKMLEMRGISCLRHYHPDIQAFYESYYHWTKTGRPLVTAKIAQTLNGKIAEQEGQPVALSNRDCAILTHKIRHKTDVILTTARTIKNDNPQFTVRLHEVPESRVLAVIDRNLSLTPTHQAIKLARHTYIFHDEKHQAPLSDDEHLSYIPIPSIDDRLDLELIIQKLGLLGYHDVLVEAGGQVFTALHERELVDKTYIYIVAKTLSQEAISSFYLKKSLATPKKIQWQALGDDMVLMLDWRKEDVCSQEL